MFCFFNKKWAGLAGTVGGLPMTHRSVPFSAAKFGTIVIKCQLQNASRETYESKLLNVLCLVIRLHFLFSITFFPIFTYWPNWGRFFGSRYMFILSLTKPRQGHFSLTKTIQKLHCSPSARKNSHLPELSVIDWHANVKPAKFQCSWQYFSLPTRAHIIITIRGTLQKWSRTWQKISILCRSVCRRDKR